METTVLQDDCLVVETAIVGAGLGGLCMAMQLRQHGRTDFVILEKASEVGGTWRDNTYPGAACDVQSHLYSYSFERNSKWKARYSAWQDIQRYILDTTQKHAIRDRIRFDSEVCAASFNEGNGRWDIQLTNGQRINARFFVLASGPLHVPNIPKIKGLDTFAGKVMHSAQWDHDYSLANKRVISIGTGGSAIQYVPMIAPEVKHLTVFQRSAAWVVPRDSRRYTAVEKTLFKHVPAWQKLHRARLYFSNELRVLPVFNEHIARALQTLASVFLKAQVRDPVVRAKLTPDYVIGCKRILISNTYYPTFNRDNVSLVTDGIQEVTHNGVIDALGKEHKADAIILGTGFITDPRIYQRDFHITGLKGRDLLTQWKDKAEAFYGVSVAGFPNMFQLIGPNTTLGHNSLIFMIENQVQHILRCMNHRERVNADYCDVKLDAQLAFNTNVQKRLEGTVWESGCQSWYQQADGHNSVIWPGTTWRFHQELKNLSMTNYHWV